MLRFSNSFLTLAIGLGLLLSGCSESRVSQCSHIVEVANQVVSQVNSVTQVSNPQDAVALKKIAGIFDAAVQQMQAVTLEDQQLQNYRDRFVTLYADAGGAARAMATAIDKQDPNSYKQGDRDLQAASNREAPLTAEVNRYCGGR
jgi:hypothetical protein